MSGLAGIVRWDGRPVAEAAAERLRRAIAHRGLDGVTMDAGASATLIFARTITTPEAAFERQPLRDDASGNQAVFDGRLDNRSELAAALGIDGLAASTDAALALASYCRWGIDCAARLLGDFSLVVWDRRARQVFAARDIMGVRPLYYRIEPHAFAFASELGALSDGTPNEGYLAEVLCSRVTSIDETIHRGVMRLPMAHAMIVGSDGLARRWRYWRPAPGTRLVYRDVREYEAHFRAVLGDAVRARLRLAGGAALMLSGGIDSSSIAAEVRQLRDQGGPSPVDVRAFSTIVPGHFADEGPAARAVSAHTGLSSTCAEAPAPDESEFRRDAEASLDLPAAPDALQQAAARSGRRVVLTGSGGDEWFSGTTGDVADLIRKGRFVRAMSWLRNPAYWPAGHRWTTPLRIGAWMAMPARLKPSVRRVLGRTAVPAWIDPMFARATNLEDRLRAEPDAVEFESIGDQYAFWAATRGDSAFHNEQGERASARDGLEERHPYYDRRLIEFALATPPEVRCAGGVPKGLVRRAMAASLPAGVTAHRPALDFGFLTVHWLESLGGAARIRRSRPCTRQWVDASAMDSMYNAMARGRTRYLWPIWGAFAVDVWLQALETRTKDLVGVP